MSRAILPVSMLCLAAAIAVVVLGRSDGASAQVPVPAPQVPDLQQVVLGVGDSFRVDGAPLGCQVTRRGGRPTIECRRGGSVTKTYGTFLDTRGLTVARFKNSTTAQTILTAKHRGSWRVCSSKARRSATASASCR